ncbi:hypothetical protein NEOLEDRAFT_1119526 [Neolentinus lepideus HHB14362 ss-1]|uniref:SH3 domain-containing protein n=1 Tax=Neolentinus lepideus HHB14362 ss-1 TaxID=1314782 RepID=A0A165QI76_9AGAM|nr:hypothetical protein NEOLEDRAFT_1119526 [Neolentinus lepideus HHB14362 ss-1]
MAARRQASTTSLAKFARANETDLSQPSLDFCNAFWGAGDGGVDVLFARMRGAARTMEELRSFWKERAAIEEDYAKRLAKLTKLPLGRDEIGELRNSLDTLRLETDKQAGFHLQMGQQIRTDLEGQTATFCARQAHHRKTFQSAIEKSFKIKQAQESHVNKAREKYEADCMRINGYTAQSTLVQGKDLEKIHQKLERVQQTVQANERDFANFARALQETARQWELDWKAFCDSCQDMEEERMDFMKDNVWAYANAVSTVCVHDDESCEKIRLALEQFEPEKDMENFVRDYGTGASIPEPPQFVNYTDPDAVMNSSSRPTNHSARFTRTTQRRAQQQAPPPAPPEDEEPPVNTAGRGAGGGRGPSPMDGMNNSTHALARNQTHSRASTREEPTTNGQPNVRRGDTMSFRPPNEPHAEPIDPTSKTMIKIGDNAYEVDPAQDPQQQGRASRRVPAQNGAPKPGVGDDSDPLARAMTELRNQAGTVRRNPTRKDTDSSRPGTSRGPTSSQGLASSSNVNLVAPQSSGSANGGSQNHGNRWRNSAEIVVGSYPLSSSPRPASPNPPTAAFMSPNRPPSTVGDSNLPVEDVLKGYQQSFPGERKSLSRQNSRRSSVSGMSQNDQGQRIGRPVSREGHAGIGAHGRSPSPGLPISRSASPSLMNVAPPVNDSRNSLTSPPRQVVRAGSSASSTRGPQRAPSPNPVGIALDPSGRVAMDSMADRYAAEQQRRQQQQQQQQPAYQNPPQANQIRRTSTYVSPTGPPNGQQLSYGAPPPVGPPPPAPAPAPAPAPVGYQPPQQSYGHPSQQYYPPPPPHVHQPQPHMGYGNTPADLQRGASLSYGGPPSHLQQPGYAGYGYQPHHSGPIARTPSPQAPQMVPISQAPPPTNQYTEEGKPVLFYVKALFDYSATIEEEFDFQAGDIIAVTATPEDGWWSGELLDEARRQPGRHIFPSNFVCLF